MAGNKTTITFGIEADADIKKLIADGISIDMKKEGIKGIESYINSIFAQAAKMRAAPEFTSFNDKQKKKVSKAEENYDNAASKMVGTKELNNLDSWVKLWKDTQELTALFSTYADKVAVVATKGGETLEEAIEVLDKARKDKNVLQRDVSGKNLVASNAIFKSMQNDIGAKASYGNIASFGGIKQYSLAETSDSLTAEQKKAAIDHYNQAMKEFQSTEEYIKVNDALTEAKKVLEEAIANEAAIREDTPLSEYSQSLLDSRKANATTQSASKVVYQNAEEQIHEEAEKARKSLQKLTDAKERNSSVAAKAAKSIITYGTLIKGLRLIFNQAKTAVVEMDRALTSMAIVTNMSRQKALELRTTFEDLAAATGSTSSAIADIATKFFQQGKSLTAVKQLTEAAAKSAAIAGIDGKTAVDLLTNAINGFQLSANQALEVSDKFAALASSSATDYEELATALSKVASQASLAGMSIDFTLGLLAKGIEVTRESPETIGTALKTVTARMRELSDYGKTLEDGMDVNTFAKSLSNVNIELMDENNEFRELADVITDVGMAWDSMNTNQQAAVAVAAAGTR